MNHICVIGGGYVGLVTAAGFAELGHVVKLIEIDPVKLKDMEEGILPINETGLPEIWNKYQQQGTLSVTDNYIEGLLGADFAFIAVGTPSGEQGEPDLKYVRQVAKSIADATTGSLTVIIKSTVPIGTADIVREILKESGGAECNLPVVSNPEFLREGTAVRDFLNPTRIVIGASNELVADAVVQLHKSLNAPVIVCDNRTAEMSKYASNTFLAARVSFMNEIALICDKLGADVVKVARIMELDPRLGKGYLSAGLGWGGSCLPKDVRGLIYMAESHDVPIPMIQAVQDINVRQPSLIVNKLHGPLGNLEGKTIGLLGLSFKPGCTDMREARSILVVELLQELGCVVKAYDPMAMEEASSIMREVTFCKDAYEVAEGSDALVLITEWAEFTSLDFTRIEQSMNTPVLIDSRNLYDPAEMDRIGFIYQGIGRAALQGHKIEASNSK